ncbi:hypothetical protein UA08_04983, partial [Talaromyces atroroseus]
MWNEETQEVIFIDFERAQYQNVRAPLGLFSPNQKWKQESKMASFIFIGSIYEPALAMPLDNMLA